MLPHPERATPGVAAMVRDEEIERIAVDAVIAYERSQGCEVESVEKDNRGFDLISRRPHPEDPKTAIEVRFIEVKGRSIVGEVALDQQRVSELPSASRTITGSMLSSTAPASRKSRWFEIRRRLDWQPIVKIEHYQVKPQAILDVAEDSGTIENK